MPKAQSTSPPSDPGHDDYSVKSTVSAYQTPDGGRFTSPTATSRSTTPLCPGWSTTSLVDSVAVMLLCRKHSTIALSALPGKGIWFPVVPLQGGLSFQEAIDDWLQQLFAHRSSALSNGGRLFSTAAHVEHLRLQVPQHLVFLNRVLLYVELIFDHSDATDCCPPSPLVSWLQAADVLKVGNLWGSEPLNFVSYALDHQLHPPPFRLPETTIRSLLAQLDGPSATAELLNAAHFDQSTVIALYSQFAQHCWPSAAMNLVAFGQLLAASLPTEPTLPPQVVQALYRSFACGSSTLTLTNFLFGMAASSHQCPHGGRVGRIRIDYIYRYYNIEQNKEGLDYNSVRWFTHDLLQLQGAPSSEEHEQALVDKCYSAFGVEPMAPVSRTAFYGAIRELKIRGTSNLFRWSGAHLNALKSQSPYGRMEQTLVSAAAGADKVLCLQCRTRPDCSLARHVVTLSTSGTVVRPIRLKVEAEARMNSRRAAAARKHSEEAFRADYYCNELLDLITAFNRSPDSSLWSVKSHRLNLMPKLVQLCTEARTLLAQEPRVVQIRSPVYVLGDIHGNLADLMTCSEVLWKSAPSRLAAHYLFLGDYVDRGNNSLECIIYLLCLKVLAPEHYTLVRGNHELREIQKEFTFERECIVKFGANSGRKLWESFNQVFDVLPVCAVIDRTIYCAHGGIPTSVTSLAVLEHLIPCPLSDPQTQSPAAHEVLWNDPMTGAEFELHLHTLRALGTSFTLSNDDGLVERGFLPNNKRGTAYYFSDTAVEAFLAENHLSQIIRGHECCPEGYHLHCGGRVLTIFSCSHYCDMRNKAAVALVDAAGKISILQIDTRANHQ